MLRFAPLSAMALANRAPAWRKEINHLFGRHLRH